MSLESHVVRTFGDDVVFPPYFFLVNWLNAAMKGDMTVSSSFDSQTSIRETET